jgi:hypothetical protein
VTRDEAVQLIQGLQKALDPEGKPTQGLNENDLGGISVGKEALYFEYDKAKGTLIIRALIYRFRAKPKPAVLEAFRTVAQTEDKGGGTFDFQGQSKSVFLSRTYEKPVTPAALKADVGRLVMAAERWRIEVVPTVAERANRASPRGKFLK